MGLPDIVTMSNISSFAITVIPKKCCLQFGM